MKIKRLRYNRRKVFLGLFLFLSLLGITVGYALITTKLTIDGVATVKDAKWDVHFTNFQAMSGSVAPVTNPTITNTDVTFSAKLDAPGDFYGFTIDVTNQGTINADIGSFTLTPDFSNIAYLDATIVYNDDTPVQTGDVLPANKTKRIKVKLEYKDGIDESLYPSVNQIHNVTLSLDYEQYTGVIASVWELPQGKTKDTLSIGDEICLKDDPTQCFNFIKYDNDDVVMLAKYNLNVGNNIQTGAVGIQNSLAIGYNPDTSTIVDGSFPSTVKFSVSSPDNAYYGYWWDSLATNGINSLYGDDYPADVYDKVNYDGTPTDTNYSVVYYVEQYKTILTNADATIKDARLLTLEEATDEIGCDLNAQTCPTTGSTSFIANTAFWLSTSTGREYILTFQNNSFKRDTFTAYGRLGVRPVIVITKSDL